MRISEDLRRRVIRAVEQGATRQAAAQRYGVGVASVYRWQRKLTASKPGPKSPRVDTVKLAQHLEQHSDMYLTERAAVFGLTPSGMWRAINRLGHSLKKPGASLK
jgi:transposase